jgi:hypothetical protein
MEEEWEMDLYFQLYEFAASAGAYEGYVYHTDRVDVKYLPNWTRHLKEAYELLPQEVKDSIQPSLDKTIGRAIKSVSKILGDDHDVVKDLKTMVKGPLPSSPNEFEKKKWFE